MHYELDDEFNARVKHNFKLYILLTSKKINWKQDDILDSIYRLHGYKCHKTVKYGMNSSHIHVKFEKEYMAKEAVDFLNNLNSDLTAVLVDYMLRDWFNYEMKSAYNPPWTLTIVDIMGSPPLGLNFLTETILNSIFKDFGDPYLLPYTAALNEPHVQILFGSMTEALAACMAFGEWHEREHKLDSFSYRVRINPSDKEAMLIRHSGGTPNEAFKLDYFMNIRNEVVRNQRFNVPSTRQSAPYYKHSQNKVTQKGRKQKLVPVINPELKQSNSAQQVGHRTPILCVPVIAPFNSFPEAFMTTSSELNANFASTLLNIRRIRSVTNKAIAAIDDAEKDLRACDQNENTDISVSKGVENFEALDKELPNSAYNSACEKPDLVLSKQTQNIMKPKRSVQKGNNRPHERRLIQ